MSLTEPERRAAVLRGETVVANCRKGADDALIQWAEAKGLAVYIGRATRTGRKRSPWANPFAIGKDGDRNHAIRQYQLYMDTRRDLLSFLHKLRGRVLVCWCYPEACHGDVLAELAMRLNHEDRKP